MAILKWLHLSGGKGCLSFNYSRMEEDEDKEDEDGEDKEQYSAGHHKEEQS